MVILQIEHEVPNYEYWKQAFESDPIDRQKSGVRRYRIARQANSPNLVIIDLEFETMEDAENTLDKLRKLWPRVEGKVIMGPQARILEIVETKEY